VSHQPPKRPWHGGDPSYTYSRLEVEIVEDENGWVFSGHDFESPVDAENAAKMQGGGVKQVAFALTTEALRREAFLCLLVEMSKISDGPEGFLQVVRDDPDMRERMADMVARGALATFMGLAQKMLPDIAREVLHMAMQQREGPENPSIE
jgi:hypothetical protein